MQIATKARTYDVCIVGSGAGGGMAAKVLTEAGADTILLEAGPQWASDKDGAMFKWNYESPRRGTPPCSTMLNQYCQAHEVKNLFVADGGPFVTNADKNVTWTILALSMRTSEHIAEEFKKGNL